MEDTEAKAGELEEMEIESKEKESEPEEAEEVEVKETETEDEPEAEPAEAPADFKAIFQELEKRLGMEELGDVLSELKTGIKTLENKIEVLEKSDDEKVAEKMKPEIDVEEVVIPLWKKRLSQSEETEIDEEEEKEIKGPETAPSSWVQEAMGGSSSDKNAVPQ